MRQPNMKIVEKTIMGIVEQAGLGNKFRRALQSGASVHVKAEVSGFMPLHIEAYHGNISVAHTYTQMGDVMHDPQIVFAYGSWLAIEYRQDNMGIYQRAGDGKYLPDASRFAKQWMKNLKAQGFTTVAHLSSLSDPKIVARFTQVVK